MGEPNTTPRGSRRHPDLRVDPLQHPGLVRGTDRLPVPGEMVHCTDGAAEVVRVLGRTQSGGRLLELSIPDGRRHPFFAAAENVMVSPTAPPPAPAADAQPTGSLR